MIELQNVNPRLRAGGNVKKRNWYLILGMLLLVQLIAIFYFGSKKAGFHYDEYYSYYSSNVSIGLVPTDREWKPGSEITDEFRVLPGQRFQYGTVTRMQTYDVHPPFYYLLLHTVCSLFPGRFSKWSGIGLNIVLFVLSWSVLAKLTRRIVTGALRSAAAPGGKAQTCVTAADVPERITRVMIFGVCLLYGFNPAVYSGVMLVRMYMLLALWILLVTWLHVKSLQERKRGFSFYLPLMAVVYLGFLTHYYFAVYLFFLAAAMELYLLLERAELKSWGQKWKDCLIYAAAVIGAMVLAVASYPACLSHIFRGYRGTEAMGAFFDLGNTLGRFRFFAGLLNEYAFGSMLYGFVLLLVLMALTVWGIGRMKAGRKAVAATVQKSGQQTAEHAAAQKSGQQAAEYAAAQENSNRQADAFRESFWEARRVFWIPAAAVLGYFLVVTKTALLTEEEANRYQIPVYGLILLLMMVIFVLLGQKLFVLTMRKGTAVKSAAGKISDTRDTSAPEKRSVHDKAAGYVLLAVFLVLATGQIRGLADGKVLFLYEEDTESIAFAQEHKEKPVVYFYNPNLTWMIWDDSLELMQYDEIYFASLADVSTVEDDTIRQADQVLVYVSRMEQTEEALQAVADGMGGDVKMEKIRELLYCDLYLIARK